MQLKVVAALLMLALASAHAQATPTLVEAAAAEGLEVLSTAIKMLGLEKDLASFSGTIFAPTNDALEAAATSLGISLDSMPTAEQAAALTDVLKLHIVPDVMVMSSDIKGGEVLPTLLGQDLTVELKGKTVTIVAPESSAKVVKPDIMLGESVAIHVIDNVLLPAMGNDTAAPAPMAPVDGNDVAELIAIIAENNVTVLATAIELLGLGETLGMFKGTLLAPTDDALIAAATAAGLDLAAGLSDEQENILKTIILYHLIPAYVLSNETADGDVLTTVLGQNLTVKYDGDHVDIVGAGSEAKLLATDLVVGDIVAHVIDAVLMPDLSVIPGLSAGPTSAPAPAPLPPSSATSAAAGFAALAASALAAVLLM